MATVKISASRLKTLQACSWQFHCKYVLKLPDATNAGALMGTCCHTVFECLLKPRHRKHFDASTLAKDVGASPVLDRYVTRYAKKHALPEGGREKMFEMILVGLMNDFFCEGGTMMEPELSFDITSKSPKYRITGFIDQPATYNDKFLRIKDYKSSKKKFEGEELSVNVQAMMYSLAGKKLFPKLTPVVDFVFLQFPERPIQRLRFSDSQLSGFEHMLADAQMFMENFDEKKAVSNLASKQKFPDSGQGFKGPLLCGWAGKKFVSHPDQKKKNGDKMYHCPFRFPFDYWALCSEDGEVLKTEREKEKLNALESEGQFIIKKRYDGCPGHSPLKA